MEYVTHLREDGSYQPLKEHLEGTATRSAKFAASFGASSHAERTALLHDIGKYSPNGQRRQRDPEHTAKVDHSTAGAKAAADLGDMPAAFAIAGHHGGLPDLGTRLSLDDGTLCARLNKKLTGGDDPSAWRSEISLPTGVQLTPSWLPRNDVRLTAMYIRMLFSCLVDADFLDTERALSKEEKPRGIGDSMPALLEKLQAHVAKWLEEPKSDLCALRNEVLPARQRRSAGLVQPDRPHGRRQNGFVACLCAQPRSEAWDEAHHLRHPLHQHHRPKREGLSGYSGR